MQGWRKRHSHLNLALSNCQEGPCTRGTGGWEGTCCAHCCPPAPAQLSYAPAQPQVTATLSQQCGHERGEWAWLTPGRAPGRAVGQGHRWSRDRVPDPVHLDTIINRRGIRRSSQMIVSARRFSKSISC